jgi:hypothetical protein
MVAPPSVTSATANAILPHYAGSAAASLSPSVSIYNTTPDRALRHAGAFSNHNASRAASTRSFHVENLPPPFPATKTWPSATEAAPGSMMNASEYLRKIDGGSGLGFVDTGFNVNTTRTGAVAPGEEW